MGVRLAYALLMIVFDRVLPEETRVLHERLSLAESNAKFIMDRDVIRHDKLIDKILKKNSMSRKPIDKDRDCCFRAVARNILHILSKEELDCQAVEHLTKLGLSKMSEDSLVTKLRELTVSEWSGENRQHYEDSLQVDVNFEKEIEQFCQPSNFTGELGVLMALAMANVLKMPIKIFSSWENYPIITIPPRQQLDGMPRLLLSFNAAGIGHYDYVCRENDLSEPEEKKEKQGKVFCSRGVNRKSQGLVANVSNDVISSYSSKCTCLKARVNLEFYLKSGV